MEIDHINGDTDCNFISNLRLATKFENKWNRKMPTTNKSGVKGVHWHKHHEVWIARVTVKGKRFEKKFKSIDKAKVWVQVIRQEKHREFTNHGTHLKDIVSL